MAASGPKFRQDMPPPGGYQSFEWHRTFPRTWFNPKRILLTLGGYLSYTWVLSRWYRKQENNKHFEDVDIRCAMQPFMKAERDRNFIKLRKENRKIEDEMMAHVPGWKTGTWFGEPVYYTLGDTWFEGTKHETFLHSKFRWNTRDRRFEAHQEYASPHFYDKYLPNWINEHIY